MSRNQSRSVVESGSGVISNPSSGIGVNFSTANNSQGFAGSGVSVYEGSKRTGAKPIVQERVSYKRGRSSQGSFKSSEGKNVEVKTTPISSEAQAERIKLLESSSSLNQKQNDELRVAKEQIYLSKFVAEKKNDDIKTNNFNYGSINVSDVTLSPSLAKKYRDEVLKQSLPISDTEPTILRVRTDVGGNTYEVNQPTSKGETQVFNPPIKTSGRDRFIELGEQAKSLKEERKVVGGIFSAGVQVAGGIYGQAKAFFTSDNKKYFDIKGNPVVDEYGKAVPQAIEYQQATQSNVMLLSLAGSGLTTVKPSPFKVADQPLPSKSTIKNFNKPYEQSFTVQPKGKVVQAKNVFSDENLFFVDKGGKVGSVLSEKVTIKYPTYEQKLTVLSPANKNGLRVSGIGINSEQITVSSVKGKGLFNYEKVTFTNSKGISRSDFFKTNKVTGKVKPIGSLGNQKATPSIKYTEPTFNLKESRTVEGTNNIFEQETFKSSQSGISNVKGKFQPKGFITSESTTTTFTKATTPGTSYTTETELFGGSGKPVLKSFNVDEVRFTYGGEPTVQTKNILLKNTGNSLKVDTITPVISETNQVTIAGQKGFVRVSKTPSIFSKLSNLKISFKPSPKSSPLVKIKITDQKFRFQPYDTAMRNDIANMDSELFRIKIGGKSRAGLVLEQQPSTVVRTVVVNKPVSPKVSFGETTIYTPVSSTVQTPFSVPVSNTGFRSINIVNSSSNVGLSSGNNIFTNQNNDVNSSFRSININVAKPKSELSSSDKLDVFSGQMNNSGIRNINISKPSSDVAQITQSDVKVVQETKQEQRFMPFFKPITIRRTTQTTPTPETPTPKIFGLPKKRKGNSNFVEGFDVYVKKLGQYRRVNPNPLSRSGAINFGSKIVDFSSSASFKILPSKSSASSSGEKISSLFSKKFYKKSTTFIEKPFSRIDSPGELAEITYKGIMSQKIRRKIYGA